MPRGPSGRIVIEVDPIFKEELYQKLEVKGLNLKEWFLRNAESYVRDETHADHYASSLHKDVKR